MSRYTEKIENDNITYNDTREIFKHDGVTAYTGDLRTLFDIRNAKDAYEVFLTAFQVKRPLDEPFMKELQFCLTQNTYDTRRWQLGERPGEYKRHAYVTGREEVGATPEDAADEVRELLEELRDVTSKDVLTAAAYFHAKFQNIHAFADGNGRVGRLAMNYLLVRYGHPPIIIHEEDRRVLRRVGSVGCPTGAGAAAGISQTADGKDVGEANCACGGTSTSYFNCSTFVLLYYPTRW